MASKDTSDQISSFLQVVVFGHVDVGKSSLVGRVYCQFGDKTEVEEKRASAQKAIVGKTLAGVESKAVEYRYMCDSSSNERAKGNTINYHSNGFNIKYPGISDRNIIFCDAPGHTEFTKNLVTGASQSDVAVLVVPASMMALDSSLKPMSSNENAKNSPCVLDHQLRLITTFGSKYLIVCVNKMGGGERSNNTSASGVTSDINAYSEENFNNIVSAVSAVTTRNGYPKGNTYFIPVDVMGADNLWTKSTNMSWFKGIDFNPNLGERSTYKPKAFHFDSLVEFFCKVEIPPRNLTGPLRMCAQSRYLVVGQGDILSCRIFQGTLEQDQVVKAVPAMIDLKVKSIEMFHRKRAIVGVGDECGVNFSLKKENSSLIKNGTVFAIPDNYPLPSRLLVVTVNWFRVQESMKSGFQCTLDSCANHLTCTLDQVLAVRLKKEPFPITGTEPECLTWNLPLSDAEKKAVKDIKLRKKDLKFKPTADEEWLLKRSEGEWNPKPCGNEYLDSITQPIEITRDVRSSLHRYIPMKPLVVCTYQDVPAMGRFCLRNSGNAIGFGIITAIKGEEPDTGKKGGKKGADKSKK